MSTPNPEAAAPLSAERLLHLCWCCYQMGANQAFNSEPTEANLRSHTQAIDAFRANPTMTPEENHENWMAFRLSQGWVLGAVRDEVAKTHPDLVPFGDLPEVERRKDEMDIMCRRVIIPMIDAARERAEAAERERDALRERLSALCDQYGVPQRTEVVDGLAEVLERLTRERDTAWAKFEALGSGFRRWREQATARRTAIETALRNILDKAPRHWPYATPFDRVCREAESLLAAPEPGGERQEAPR